MVDRNVAGRRSNRIGINPYRRQFHFQSWIIKKIPGVSILESHNKIINIFLSSNGLVDSAPAS